MKEVLRSPKALAADGRVDAIVVRRGLWRVSNRRLGCPVRTWEHRMVNLL